MNFSRYNWDHCREIFVWGGHNLYIIYVVSMVYIFNSKNETENHNKCRHSDNDVIQNCAHVEQDIVVSRII